jgi:hypothetical protein
MYPCLPPYDASCKEECERPATLYSSGVGRLYAEDLIVKIEGAAGTMIVSA